MAAVLGAVFSRMQVDCHAAYGIDDALCRFVVLMLMF
jgi:hypothetical protein